MHASDLKERIELGDKIELKIGYVSIVRKGVCKVIVSIFYIG